jgi:hypothetical protein
MIRHHGLPATAATIVAASLIAPWALGFSGSHPAVAGHIFIAMTFGPVALLIRALPAAAAFTAVGGAWLAASPWALGYGSRGVAAWSADLIAGVALILLSRRALRRGAADRPRPVRVWS